MRLCIFLITFFTIILCPIVSRADQSCTCVGLASNFPGYSLICDAQILQRFPFGTDEKVAGDSCFAALQNVEPQYQFNGSELACNFIEDIAVNQKTKEKGSFNLPILFDVKALTLEFNVMNTRVRSVLENAQISQKFIWDARQNTCTFIAAEFPVYDSACYSVLDSNVMGGLSNTQIVIPMSTVIGLPLEVHVVGTVGFPDGRIFDLTDRFKCERMK